MRIFTFQGRHEQVEFASCELRLWKTIHIYSDNFWNFLSERRSVCFNI